MAARNSTRGGRRHGGVVEEVILIDGTALNEVILPLMNVSRRAANGKVDPNETINKSQIYVTTAGYKGTFAYEKLLQILVWQVVHPDRAFVMGGTWRIPVLHQLLDKNFVMDMKLDGTFNETSFAREYESQWTGSVENSFFKPALFDRYRVLKQPEYEGTFRTKQCYYVIGVDVGRLGCQSVAVVFKVSPQIRGTPIKQLVNIFVYEEEHFKAQALKLKRLYYRFQPKAMVIDGNGLGVGLIDEMIIQTVDETTKETYPPFGVINDTNNYYQKYMTPDTEQDAIYIIKATAEINTEAHTNVLSQISSGKVRFLIDERAAKSKFLSTKVGSTASTDQRANYLKPFTLTSILREEMLNLKEEREGKYLNLTTSNKKIKKDKFSAFEYGLYYIKLLEDAGKGKKRVKFSSAMFFQVGKK